MFPPPDGVQLIEQAPGPLGSPHVPHAPTESDEVFRDPVPDPTAKVDNNFSRFVPLQEGHAGSIDGVTIFSKRVPHP